MSKYHPLRDYLMRQSQRELTLTFREIESILGFALPANCDRPQWWANVRAPATTHVQREAWRAARYDAFLVRDAQRVIFRRISPAVAGELISLGIGSVSVHEQHHLDGPKRPGFGSSPRQ